MFFCFLVGAGGFLGAVCRYLIGVLSFLFPLSVSFFPFLTLFINVLGSLIIGILVGLVDKSGFLTSNMILFLKVGFCGGFTTFSSFALETSALLAEGRILIGVIYIILSVLLCVGAVFLGENLVR